jgi:hypothetical protein
VFSLSGQEESTIDLPTADTQPHTSMQKDKRKYHAVLIHQKRVKRNQKEKLIFHLQGQ